MICLPPPDIKRIFYARNVTMTTYVDSNIFDVLCVRSKFRLQEIDSRSINYFFQYTTLYFIFIHNCAEKTHCIGKLESKTWWIFTPTCRNSHTIMLDLEETFMLSRMEYQLLIRYLNLVFSFSSHTIPISSKIILSSMKSWFFLG